MEIVKINSDTINLLFSQVKTNVSALKVALYSFVELFKRDRFINREIRDELHEIEREIVFYEMDTRVYESLMKKKNVEAH